ncbi:MAG: hypothetical protein RIQ74_2722 [Pseudomonadota bacterium]
MIIETVSYRVLIHFQFKPSARPTLRNDVSHFGKSRQNHRHPQNLFYFFIYLISRRNNILLIPRRLRMTFPSILFLRSIFAGYSLAKAATGSSCAAFRAGKKPNTIPIMLEQTKAATIEVVE